MVRLDPKMIECIKLSVLSLVLINSGRLQDGKEDWDVEGFNDATGRPGVDGGGGGCPVAPDGTAEVTDEASSVRREFIMR